MMRPSPALRCFVLLAAVACLAGLPPTAGAGAIPVPGAAAGATTGDGEGPFRGLATAPGASPSTGAATTSVPIVTPPGRAGATPRLELHYSSAGGPSAYGHGWSLPLARIVRSTRHGVPKYDDSDVFVLETADGSMDLEPVDGTPRYRATIEGAFLRIGFDRNRNQWTVIDRSGTTTILGAEASTRMGPDPTRAEGTYAWLVTRTIDTSGNAVDYRYVPPRAGAPSTSGLPERIDYGANEPAGIPHFFSVRFTWTYPPYPSVAPVSYQAGYAQYRDALLLRIETYVDDELVRRYGMNHDQDPATGATRLVGVSLDAFADNPDNDVALPSTVFRYTDSVVADWPVGNLAQRALFADAIEAPGPVRHIDADVLFDTFDINGDGAADWVDLRGADAVVRLGSPFGFSQPQTWAWPAIPRKIRKTSESNGNLEVNVFDITGDGRPDLVDGRSSQCGTGYWCVYENTGSGFSLEPLRWAAPRQDIRHMHSGGARVLIDVADLNGDGRPDWIDATTRSASFPYWSVHWNTGEGFSAEAALFRAPRDHISREYEDNGRRHLIYGLFDMNGDGLADFVVADTDDGTGSPPGRWDVYFNDGSGFATTPHAWRIEGSSGLALAAFINETGGNPSRSRAFIDLFDITGDGLPDWVRPWTGADALSGYDPPECAQQPACDPDGTQTPPACCFPLLVFANTGSSFSEPVAWAMWDSEAVRSYREDFDTNERQFDIFDIDGDGLVDLVELGSDEWRVFRHPASPLARWSPLPLHDRGKPNLLLSMMNGVGGETHLRYLPATVMEDTRIPFPMWVVIETETRDSVGNAPAARTTHLYRGGRWDGENRELLGFREIWRTDAGGTTVLSRFLQDRRRRGLVEENVVLAKPPCTPLDATDPNDPCSPLKSHLRVDRNTWSEDGSVFLLERSSTPYANNRPIPELAKHTAYEYDTYGNVVRETVYSPSAGTVVTETSYVTDIDDGSDGIPRHYIVDKPAHTLTYEATASVVVLSEERFRYDNRGLLTEGSRCRQWDGVICRRWQTTRQAYDRAGNITATVDPSGAKTRYEFDARALYPHRKIDALRGESVTEVDLRNARETRTRTPSGMTYYTEYDGLGRPIRHWDDEFSRNDPRILTTYTLGTPAGDPGVVLTREVGRAPTAIFYDGLGREIATKTRTETAEGIKTVVSGLKQYDAAGRVVAQSVLFEAPTAQLTRLTAAAADVPAWTRYTYDPAGRPQETELPDGSKTRIDASMPGVTVKIGANLIGGEHPGSATIELRDGLDRTWRKDVCAAAPSASDPAACPPGTLLDRTEYEYDGLDRPIRVTLDLTTSSPATTEITYDGLGNRTSFSSSDLGTWRYEYDARGLVVRAVDPRGFEVKTGYDKLGRVRFQRAEGFRTKYVYHRRGPGTGRVRKIRARSGRARVTKQFDYDVRGRVVTEQIRIAAGGPTRRATTSYVYDRAGRRTQVSYPTADGSPERLAVTTYTQYGKPLSLSVDEGGSTRVLVREAQYDLYGNLTRLVYGNDLTDLFVPTDVSELSRLACIRTTSAGAPELSCLPQEGDLRALEITARDTAGNIRSLNDTVNPPGSALSQSRSFEYDALGRLIEASGPNGVQEQFTYDGHGNLVQAREDSFFYSANAPHLVVFAGDHPVEHDAAGNRTRKGPWTYSYDALGRLSEVRYGERLRETEHYDEGQTRVARYDAREDRLRYYFGGLFEIDGELLVRHYYFAGRLVASDVITAERGIALSGATMPQRAVAGPGSGHRAFRDTYGDTPAAERFANDRRADPPLPLLPLAFVVLLLALGACTQQRQRIAMVTAIALIVATTPRLSAQAATRLSAGQRTSATAPASTAVDQLFYYHLDHQGTPLLVTDRGGNVVEYRRYSAYGDLTGIYGPLHEPLPASASDLGYTGHVEDAATGLIYFGARFYDPELGLFLTPDPQAQFASPYLYAGGNPVNGADPDGEFFGLLAAVLVPIITSAAISAFVSSVTASLQGGDFADGLVSGFTTGLIGAGIGTVLGGLNIAYQLATANGITGSEAAVKLVEVAARSSFTSTVTHAVVSVAEVSGASSDLLTAIAVVTPLLASFAYDNYIIKDSGAASNAGGSQRETAKAGIQRVNTTAGHTNVTAEAAQGTQWERDTAGLVAANVAEDGPPPTGNPVADMLAKAEALASNQQHFGRLASTHAGIVETARGKIAAATDAVLKKAKKLTPKDIELFNEAVVKAVGAATHYVQDHLTLGHMVPGTQMLAGPFLAPLRFVIHQVFGGEIAFRQAQLRATRELLNTIPRTHIT